MVEILEGKKTEEEIMGVKSPDSSPDKQSTSEAASPDALKTSTVKAAKRSKKAELRDKREKKKEAKAINANRQSIQIKTMDEWIKELELAKVKKDLMAHFGKLAVTPAQE